MHRISKVIWSDTKKTRLIIATTSMCIIYCYISDNFIFHIASNRIVMHRSVGTAFYYTISHVGNVDFSNIIVCAMASSEMNEGLSVIVELRIIQRNLALYSTYFLSIEYLPAPSRLIARYPTA